MADGEHRIEPADTLEVRDLEALRALTDPLRLRLVDLLRQAARTTKELAAAMEVEQPRSTITWRCWSDTD